MKTTNTSALFIMLLLIAQINTFAFEGIEQEDNNTAETANNFEINSSISGTITLNTDYYDYFKFTLPYDGKISFTIVPSASFDSYLDLFDINGFSFLKASQQTGNGVIDTLIYNNLKAGTYFIRVGGNGDGSYSLQNFFTPTSIPSGNDNEPNNDVNKSVNLTINITTTGHIGFWSDGSTDYYDWYSFEIPYDGKIAFNTLPENTLDTYLDLFDINGFSFLKASQQTGNGKNDTLVYSNLMAGKYFIRVGGAGYGSYTLVNVFTPTSIPNGNDVEPNNSETESVLINTNSSKTGHIGFMSNGSTDYYDWYSISIPSDGTISIVSIPENSLDTYLDFFNNNGTKFLKASTQTGIGINDTIIYENLKAGDYYIRVGGSGYGSYTLSNSFTVKSLFSENFNSETIKIYALNSQGLLMIEKNTATQNSIVYVYDIQGRLIVSEHLDNEKTQIDFKGQKGIFFIKVQMNNEIHTAKVMF